MTFDIKLNMKLDAFFSQYTQAFDALSAESIADLYRLPCATSDGDGVNVYSDRQSLIEKFAGNCDAMKGFGYQKSIFRILEQQDLGEDFGAGLYAVEVDYLIREEWARTAEDVLWRRSKLGLYLKADQVTQLQTYIDARTETLLAEKQQAITQLKKVSG